MEKLEIIIKEILTKNKLAREDDNLLYIEVIYKCNPSYVNVNFLYTFTYAKYLGLPAFESVSRCRRKIQAENEDLKGSLENQIARDKKEINIFEYVIGI